MPRYLVERTWPEGLAIPMDDQGAGICQTVVDNNLEEHVTWVHSYVTDDKRKTFCIYDGPSPEAILESRPAQQPADRPHRARERA